jgi:ribosome-associated heat shock protein Hsp15
MDNQNNLRIDKWLCAARFFKTRQLAVKAIKAGRIAINGHSVKPSSLLKLEDVLSVKSGPYTTHVEIEKLLDKRGSATVAQTMYQETQQSAINREALKQQLANQPKIEIDRQKPDKRGVRSHRSLKRGD